MKKLQVLSFILSFILFIPFITFAYTISSEDYKEIKNVDKSEIKFIVLAGIIGGSSWLLYYKALQDGPTSAVAAIDKLSVLVAVVLSYFIFNEKMKAKEIIGLLLILVGTIGLAFKI